VVKGFGFFLICAHLRNLRQIGFDFPMTAITAIILR